MDILVQGQTSSCLGRDVDKCGSRSMLLKEELNGLNGLFFIDLTNACCTCCDLASLSNRGEAVLIRCGAADAPATALSIRLLMDSNDQKKRLAADSTGFNIV